MKKRFLDMIEAWCTKFEASCAKSEELRRREWQRSCGCGRRQFILRSMRSGGTTLLGLYGLLILLFWYEKGTWEPLASGELWLNFGFWFLMALIGNYYLTSWMWSENERKYAHSDGRAESGDGVNHQGGA